MRTRMTLLIVAIVLMAGFAALNWSEFVRPAQLSWGWNNAEAPLGLILLAVIAVSWVGFLLGSAYLETSYQLAAHRNSKALEAQRLLADKAEASRFTELRSYLESRDAVALARENAATAGLEHASKRDQQELLAAIDRLDAKLAIYTGDLAERVVIRHDERTPHLS